MSTHEGLNFAWLNATLAAGINTRQRTQRKGVYIAEIRNWRR